MTKFKYFLLYQNTIFFIASFTLLACQQKLSLLTETSIYRQKLELHKNTKRFPNFLPTSLIYPKATTEWLLLQKSEPLFYSDEAALILSTHSHNNQTNNQKPKSRSGKKVTIKDVERYYKKVIRKEGWQIIQYEVKPNKIFIMSESIHNRIVSVIIQNDIPKKKSKGNTKESSEKALGNTPTKILIKIYTCIQSAY